MEESLIFWILKKFGAKRDYVLTPEEWRKFIPYSDKTMNLKYKKWQKESRQEGGNSEPQIN